MIIIINKKIVFLIEENVILLYKNSASGKRVFSITSSHTSNCPPITSIGVCWIFFKNIKLYYNTKTLYIKHFEASMPKKAKLKIYDLKL